jgi:hypothetical protein
MIYINHFSCFSSRLQVRDLVEKCTCPSQFPMIRVSEGKYRIGDTKVLIFVRVSQKSAIAKSINKHYDLWRNGYGKVQLLACYMLHWGLKIIA